MRYEELQGKRREFHQQMLKHFTYELAAMAELVREQGIPRLSHELILGGLFETAIESARETATLMGYDRETFSTEMLKHIKVMANYKIDKDGYFYLECK